LSEWHEVRQFALGWDEPFRVRGRVLCTDLSPSFRQYHYFHPFARSLSGIARRAWVRSPLGSGAALRVLRPGVLDALLEWADVVLVEFPWQFEHCRRRRPRAPLVLASHNLEYLKFLSWADAAGVTVAKVPWIPYVRRAEANAASHADLVVAVSCADRELYLKRYGLEPGRVVVVPNGADTTRYAPSDHRTRRDARARLGLPEKPTAVFVGADVAHNQVGLRHVLRLAELTDRFTFLIVGSVAKPARTANVVASGFVEDLRPFLQAADFALCPIEHGGGTKVKLVEYLAAGLPTVVFPEALEGLDMQDGQHVLVADKSPSGLLAALEQLIRDDDLATRLGEEGRRRVVDQYSWRQSAATLDRALASLVNDPGH
jgi:glycosyltransferase involved in cell wall biosynthesis